MRVSDSPPWSKNKLKKLGQALLQERPVPDGCPSYNEVMLWHHELGAEVAQTIRSGNWDLQDDIELHVSSRGKTVDTLRQKLERSGIGLEAIQDLAGVRVDGNFDIYTQTLLANTIADFYDVDERGIRDLREDPHSGYRAVHLWVRCPAGRVEIQIRTEGQSEWANTYERLGDVLGRGIRYEEAVENPSAPKLVDGMHQLSRTLAYIEAQVALTRVAAVVEPGALNKLMEMAPESEQVKIREMRGILEEADSNRLSILGKHDEYLASLREIRRMIEEIEEVEVA